jgi:hypothetical protein
MGISLEGDRYSKPLGDINREREINRKLYKDITLISSVEKNEICLYVG